MEYQDIYNEQVFLLIFGPASGCRQVKILENPIIGSVVLISVALISDENISLILARLYPMLRLTVSSFFLQFKVGGDVVVLENQCPIFCDQVRRKRATWDKLVFSTIRFYITVHTHCEAILT